MGKKSKRLITLLKRKSISKPAIRRKSRRNIRFIKRGGEINVHEVVEKLNEINEIRNEKGDFEQVPVVPLKEFKEGLARDSTGKLTDQSLDKLLAYHQATGTGKATDLATWVNFGKQQRLNNDRDISRFTDDIIMTLLKNYDLNSAKMLFMNNIFDVNPSMIQQYLPTNMWSKFGGITRFTTWLSKMVDPILSKELEPSATSKLPITKDTLSNIMTQLKEKYPRINSKDPRIQDLILKDLFKKLYYLKNDKSSQGSVMSGGGGLETLGMVIGGVIVLFTAVGINVKLDESRTERDIIRLQKGLPSEAEDLRSEKWRETLEKHFQEGTIPEKEIGLWGKHQYYNQDYRDAYANYRLKQMEQTQSSDLYWLTHGIRPSSLLMNEAEKSWKGEKSSPERARERSKADEKTYRDAFVDYKLGEYERMESELRNQMDKEEELKTEALISGYELNQAKIRNQLDEQRRRDLALMSQGKRPNSGIYKEADRARLGLSPLDEADRQIATSDAYQQEYKPYQAKKTSDKVFGLFNGFGF